MRILADENVPRSLVDALRGKGHDVLWVRDIARGAGDEHVLALAQRERRVVLTADKDFGELAVRRGLSADCGVVLLRLAMAAPQAEAERALAALGAMADWRGHFATVTNENVRLRRLPTTGESGPASKSDNDESGR